MDEISANSLELEVDNIQDAHNYLCDYSQLTIEFNQNELKRISDAFKEFISEFNIKEWVVVYKSEDDRKKIEEVISPLINKKTTNLKLFPIFKAQEAYKYFNIAEIYQLADF